MRKSESTGRQTIDQSSNHTTNHSNICEFVLLPFLSFVNHNWITECRKGVGR